MTIAHDVSSKVQNMAAYERMKRCPSRASIKLAVQRHLGAPLTESCKDYSEVKFDWTPTPEAQRPHPIGSKTSTGGPEEERQRRTPRPQHLAS